MQRPLQIEFRGMERSEAIENDVRHKAEVLERFSEQITGCRVVVEAPHQHHRKGNLYSVRVDLRVPAGPLVVSTERRRHHAHEDVHVAIRDAFDAAVRQLEDHVRLRRQKVKRHTVSPRAHVTRLFPGQGYGFLETPDGLEVYFHENSVVDGVFSQLRVGDAVRLVMGEPGGEKGPQASTVVRLGGRRADASVTP